MEADVIVDRRRMRRRLSFWRVVAFAAIAAAALFAITAFSGGEGLFEAHRPQIARVSVTGVILTDRKRVEMLKKIGKSDAVKAVILSLDTPGGTTTGGEELYKALRELAEKKPLVATVNTMAASAGYMAAISAERIFARQTSITGSIGVIFQFAEVTKLAETIGVDVEAIRSGKLKAQPSPFEPASEESRSLIKEIVADSYTWFVDLVAERRGVSADDIRAAEGRIFTGAQGLKAGLVDEIGGEDEAVAWLETEKGIEEDLPVRDWKPEPIIESLSFGDAALAFIADRFGISGQFARLRVAEKLISDKLLLDGLLSVWHAPAIAARDNLEGADR
ncbi:MAG TPA: signal peptide peptidase SppA [Kaistiaceae bacterium]|nr:signal peptide peptidase SppA [Kaistiaceae bacterium]